MSLNEILKLPTRYTLGVNGVTLETELFPLISKVAGDLYMGGVQQGVQLPDEFEFVVSLCDNVRYALPRTTTNLQVTMYDSLEMPPDAELRALASAVNEFREAGTVFVHCQAGLNRSALIVATALLESGEFGSAEFVIKFLRDLRSEMVLSNPAFEAWLRAQYPA